ncbi:MAG: translocation/assembly module TamB domain-containing protein, partial [Halobacteriovoraceae bacterium]|nr:translocation/assembly module TamB domain-containing protein [Halobacteriovoraceae bacterium]
EGKVIFNDGIRKETPELKFSGVSSINEYDVFIKMNGSLNKLDINMESFPLLSQDDILGLLVLGVPVSVSKQLGKDEQESIVRLGIGSFIVDQLGINKNLHDNLGLQFKIIPTVGEEDELSEQEDTDVSLLTNNVKSSTKIQVKKRINKNIDLTVNSEAGSTGQSKRDMAVDVRLKNNFSVKGVYEIETTDNEDLKSFGIDLIKKFKF